MKQKQNPPCSALSVSRLRFLRLLFGFLIGGPMKNPNCFALGSAFFCLWCFAQVCQVWVQTCDPFSVMHRACGLGYQVFCGSWTLLCPQNRASNEATGTVVLEAVT